MQDIIALRQAVPNPTDTYCVTIVRTLYALGDSLHGQDDIQKKQLAEKLKSHLDKIHREESNDKEETNPDAILDTI